MSILDTLSDRFNAAEEIKNSYKPATIESEPIEATIVEPVQEQPNQIEFHIWQDVKDKDGNVKRYEFVDTIPLDREESVNYIVGGVCNSVWEWHKVMCDLNQDGRLRSNVPLNLIITTKNITLDSHSQRMQKLGLSNSLKIGATPQSYRKFAKSLFSVAQFMLKERKTMDVQTEIIDPLTAYIDKQKELNPRKITARLNKVATVSALTKHALATNNTSLRLKVENNTDLKAEEIKELCQKHGIEAIYVEKKED